MIPPFASRLILNSVVDSAFEVEMFALLQQHGEGFTHEESLLRERHRRNFRFARVDREAELRYPDRRAHPADARDRPLHLFGDLFRIFLGQFFGELFRIFDPFFFEHPASDTPGGMKAEFLVFRIPDLEHVWMDTDALIRIGEWMFCIFEMALQCLARIHGA